MSQKFPDPHPSRSTSFEVKDQSLFIAWGGGGAAGVGGSHKFIIPHTPPPSRSISFEARDQLLFTARVENRGDWGLTKIQNPPENGEMENLRFYFVM